MASGRSFADPLSSSVQFTAYDLKRGLGDILVHRLPYHALPQVLHELTHQWCFNSVLGRTITYLLFRVQRDATRGDPDGRARRDAMRAELIQQILLPLAEGMALFAEHDLYPGSVESTARPLLACAPLVAYNGAQSEQPFSPFDNLSQKLSAARMRPSHLDRKASLLLEPLSSHASPYSLGYLTIKSLQRQGAQRDERMLDSDLFLQVVHGYFYEDWNFVAELLDDDVAVDEVAASQRLLDYLRDRLDQFAQSINGAAIDAFIDRSIHPEKKGPQFECEINGLEYGFPVDEFEPPAHASGRSRLEALMRDALDLAPIQEEGPLSTLVSSQLFIFAAAQVITLGGADVTARRLPHHLMLMMDDELPSAILPYSGTLPVGWEGTLRVVAALVVEKAALTVLMFDDEKLVADVGLDRLRSRMSGDLPLLDLIANPMLDPRQRSEMGGLLRMIMRECVGEIAVGDAALAGDIDSVYLSILDSGHGRVGSATAVISSLARRTLLDLLDDDLRLVESAALVSLLSASRLVPARLPADRTTLAEDIAVVNERLAPLFGFPPMAVTGIDNLTYSAL